ncbi:MAG: PorT family protein [Gloeobacteraceae cyanobacterium ES-bin-316]|nr:PorT family protein [Ferruginibacter sp.]
MQYLLRRKIIGILLAFMAIPCIVPAQSFENLNQLEHDEKNFHFGINLGINRSHYSFTHHPRFLQYDSVTVVESINSSGINLAWLVNKRLSNHFDLRTYPLNLTFTEKAFQYNLTYPDKPAGEDSVTIRKIQCITLALPVQLKFSSDRINNFKVYMLAGGKVEYDLAANKGAKNAENLMKLKKLDYGIEAGIGFHLYFPVFVLTPELKLGWGLNNMHVRDPDLKYSNVIDKINARSVTFSLTVE